jgi:hypothetical protein
MTERVPRLTAQAIERQRILKIYGELIDFARSRIANTEGGECRRWFSALSALLGGAAAILRDSDISKLQARLKTLEAKMVEENWKPPLIKAREAD